MDELVPKTNQGNLPECKQTKCQFRKSSIHPSRVSEKTGKKLSKKQKIIPQT